MGLLDRKGERIRIVALLLFVLAALMAKLLAPDQYFSMDQVKEHKEQLLTFVRTHYVQAVLTFIGLYLGTALLLPGALALTVAGGMLFGMVPAVVYVNVGATTGAVLAFLAARFIFGDWIQARFEEQLSRLNRELARHGHNYLLILRILPLIPFFAVNYCAGLTKIRLGTFVWTTSLGIVPGSLIFAYIGQELRSVNAARDLFSLRIVLPLVLLSLLAVAPVVYSHLTNGKR